MERVSDARLSYPQLRRPARKRRRQRTSACRAGCTASATMAACCSSTCATITASPRSSPTATFAGASDARELKLELVVTIDGVVKARAPEAVNPNLPTGEIEVFARAVTVQSRAEELPLIVNSAEDYPEETRLKYRFLDLRRERLHRNIMLRSGVIACLRRRMIEQGFTEFQTPILGASSPEGARDYPGAEPPASGPFLRAPAGAADVQAAADGRGLRPLFPDRPVLPRRGPARRSFARVLPARLRDELRHARRRVQCDRAGACRRVRGIRGRQDR